MFRHHLRVLPRTPVTILPLPTAHEFLNMPQVEKFQLSPAPPLIYHSKLIALVASTALLFLLPTYDG